MTFWTGFEKRAVSKKWITDRITSGLANRMLLSKSVIKSVVSSAKKDVWTKNKITSLRKKFPKERSY